jgi:hypothetical protein
VKIGYGQVNKGLPGNILETRSSALVEIRKLVEGTLERSGSVLCLFQSMKHLICASKRMFVESIYKNAEHCRFTFF